MRMPESIPNPYDKLCKLSKSLYGLKQASRQWFAKLADFVKHQATFSQEMITLFS